MVGIIARRRISSAANTKYMYIVGLAKFFYYIYNLTTRKLEKLSDGGPQQVPT